MSTVILAAALIWTAEADATELKGFHEYSQQVRDTLRREATAESPGRRAAAVRRLAELYREVSFDPRLETSDTLKQLRIKLWSRLTAIKRDLERQIARSTNASPPAPLAGDDRLLEDDDAAAEALAARMALMAYSLDGPGVVAAANETAFGGGAVAGDWGPALVALIERTIAPDKWDSAGGPFSIMYFAPLKVLVVRATGEVHHQIGGALRGVRAAGP